MAEGVVPSLPRQESAAGTRAPVGVGLPSFLSKARSAQPFLNGRCPVRRPDASLLRRWHARTPGRRRRGLPTCPSGREELPSRLRNNTAVRRKYRWAATVNWCEPGSSYDWNVGTHWLRLHKCVLVTAFSTWLAYLRPGDLVLDWGSGCGHKLGWGLQLFGVRGLGVELNKASAAWANKQGLGRSCSADGRDLRWVPDGSLDAVISFAAIYHIHGHEQCDTLGQLVQKLRPKRRALLGWLAPYEWYAPILRGTHGHGGPWTHDFTRFCHRSNNTACQEALQHMIPPGVRWGACFSRLRFRWRRRGIKASFRWRSGWDTFIDARDRAAIMRRFPKALAGYSLFVTRHQ
mmetsp:Transcript_66420/g.209994  ORF Transcript_66420/g.209994 Transcript_66420/m.209994 type:complete len:347 (-) Transcript_66420:159-1199(-)